MVPEDPCCKYNNNKTKSEGLFTWCWGSHVHSWCSYGSFSWRKQWCWWSHLTGRGFIPPWLPLTGPWGRSLTHWLISSVCAWRFSPATPVSRGLPFCLWCFVPAVLAYTSCGSTVARRGMARCVPARGGRASRCVTWSGVPHAGTGSGPWGLTAFRAARCFIPSAVWRCVRRGVSWSLQGTRNKDIRRFKTRERNLQLQTSAILDSLKLLIYMILNTEKLKITFVFSVKHLSSYPSSSKRLKLLWLTSAVESAWSQLDIFLGVALEGVWSAVWSQRRLRFVAAWAAADPLTAFRSPDLAFSASCWRISLYMQKDEHAG